jgi:5'-AMP-activated protein kinase catalytic alpha subunit
VYKVINNIILIKMAQPEEQAAPMELPLDRLKSKTIGNYVLGTSKVDSGKTLGKGTFGKVKLAEQTLTKEKVAIKILEKDRIIDVADVERVAREIHILKLIRHPNIIQLYEVKPTLRQIIETPKQLFLVMEYLQNGELFEYIVQKKK